MNAVDVVYNIIQTSLPYNSFKYCLVSDNKKPKKIDGTNCKPNNIDDFVDFEKLLQCENLHSYAGVGVSIQASNLCAIDVDKCFAKPFDLSSADNRAIDVLEMFENVAYIEFSFSGTGLRVFFRTANIENYSAKYYIKNDKTNIEYYQPQQSARYVTITGRTIVNNNISTNVDTSLVISFLNKFMIRPIRQSNTIKTTIEDNRSIEELLNLVKHLYFKDYVFQDLWFSKAPGSGKDESQRDYHLVAYLYENVTQDKDKLKLIFEQSPFFKTKDFKHIQKWTNNNYRYFNYLYTNISTRR